MEIGIGLDPTLRLSWDEQRQMAREAADLGYSSAWTPSGPAARDAFHVCSQWNMATRDVVPGGISTGISVVPVPAWSPPVLASQAGTVGELTGGRFILGIGSGGIYSPEFQRTWGRPAWPPIAMMRDYVSTVRALLAGEKIDHEGPSVSLHGVQLSFRPPNVPVFLGALGPQMLRLSGEVSDGAALNWCTPEQIAISREKMNAGARKAGRDPSDVRLAEYIRVCVDDDVDVARRAYTRAAMGYALGRVPGASQSGYRAHFGRMGYDDDLKRIEAGRANGMPEEEVVDAFPPEMLLGVGYYGHASGAAEAFRRLSVGLDIAVVRVVAGRPGVESVRAVMRACAPQSVTAA
jgi:alkanesulfonate monooxygenase SsuD/methylene tetrahydromethanopterin reductase-like flavin-dependent oxidoreductase (luciferase family)